MDFYTYIEDYCEGRLTQKDTQAFGNALKKDVILQNKVRNYEDAKKISEGLLEIDIIATLDRLKNNNTNKKVRKFTPTIKRSFNYKRLLIAASFIGLIFFISKNFLSASINHDKLFAELYEEPIWPIERGSNEDIIPLASNYYLNDKFEEAKRLLLDSLDNKAEGRFLDSRDVYKGQ